MWIFMRSQVIEYVPIDLTVLHGASAGSLHLIFLYLYYWRWTQLLRKSVLWNVFQHYGNSVSLFEVLCVFTSILQLHWLKTLRERLVLGKAILWMNPNHSDHKLKISCSNTSNRHTQTLCWQQGGLCMTPLQYWRFSCFGLTHGFTCTLTDWENVYTTYESIKNPNW